MTLTRNPDGTLTLTLTAKEQKGLVFAESLRGPMALDSQIDAALKMFRQDLKQYNEEQMLVKYDALAKAQQDAVDAILSEANLTATLPDES